MNMTPLIDVTFQLIIFFLLVNNIAGEQIVEMRVPDLEDPKTFELQGENKITINVAPQPYTANNRPIDNALAFAGEAMKVQIFSKEFAYGDVEGITAELKAVREQNPDAEVLLRADAALYYDQVQPAMAAIAAAGIQKVNLVAYIPQP
jgi:biopolymer transport protein ExbD